MYERRVKLGSAPSLLIKQVCDETVSVMLYPKTGGFCILARRICYTAIRQQNVFTHVSSTMQIYWNKRYKKRVQLPQNRCFYINMAAVSSFCNTDMADVM